MALPRVNDIRRTFVTSILPYRRRLAGAALLSLSAILVAAPAGAEASGKVQVSIAAAPLGEALRAFSQQTGKSVIFTEALVEGRTSPPVKDMASEAEALAALLAGSGLEAVEGRDSYVIRAQTRPAQTTTPPAATAPDLIPPAPAEDEEELGELRIDRVLVTGTSLRGFAPESSPLFVFSREDILGRGITSTEQFIRTLPQSSGAGSSEFAPAGLPGDSSSTFNNTFGSGANLRGLGSGATLTLLNGRRLAPTSRIGDFVDLSMIPISALDRIDVLTDGASSIYGGDAVAGVVNFVLREDFEGAETSLRYGSVTEGDLREVRASQTAGTGWSGGNLLGTYEYTYRDDLNLSDRPQIPVPRLTNGQPIPDAGLFDLLPKQRRHSALLSGRQEIGPDIRLAASAVYSQKDVKSITVFASNTSSVLSFDAASEFLSAGGGVEWDISPRWTLSLDGNLSQIRNKDVPQTLSPVVSQPASRRTRSDLWSADLLLTGDLFELAGGTVKAALGGHYREEEFRNETAIGDVDRDGRRDIGALYAEIGIPVIGAENAVPGIRRLDVNLSGRIDDYSDFGTTSNPKLGLLWSPVDGLNLRSSYSTSFAPPPLGRTGDLTRAASVAPFEFIASLLGGVPLPDPSLAGFDYLQAGGTAADLDPETSKTWTFGLDHQGETGPHRWSLRSTYYNIEFDGRLGTTPVPQNQLPVFAAFLAFDNPESFPPGTVIYFPTQAQVDAVVASLSRPVDFFGGPAGLTNVGVINNASVVRNLSSTRTDGIDVDASYTLETGLGDLSAGVNANYIFGFTQQAAATTPEVETLNTILNPVDLQVRGRLGLVRGDVSGTVFLNYTDSYQTDTTAGARPVDSWTTVDLTLAWQPDEDREGWLAGTRFALSVSNLFDEPPPVTPPLGTVRLAGFDPANASPLMRFVAFEISKSF